MSKKLTDRQIQRLSKELEITFKVVDDMEDFFDILRKNRYNFVDYYVSKNTPFKNIQDEKKFENHVRFKIQNGLLKGTLKRDMGKRATTVKFNKCYFLHSVDLSREFQELYDFATKPNNKVDVEKNGNSRGKKFDNLVGCGVVYLLVITRSKEKKQKKQKKKKKIVKKKSNVKKRKRDANKSKQPKKKQKICKHTFGDPTLKSVKGGKFLAVSSCSKCGEINSKVVSC